MIHLDTSFLIDLDREIRCERPAAAFKLLETLDEKEVLCASVHVVCEVRAGAELAKQPLAEHETLDRLLSGLRVVYPDDRFPAAYARLFAATGLGRKPVEGTYLLIACAALLDDAPLVTKNVKDFSRVPGLRVIGY